jgi:hypothetical protein
MSDLSTCRMSAEYALTFAANEWERSGESAQLAVGVLAIAAVAVVLGADATLARALAASVLTATPAPRFAEAPLFTALTAAVAAFEVRGGGGFTSEYVELLSQHTDGSAGDTNALLLEFALHGAPLERPVGVTLDISPALLSSGKPECVTSVVHTIETWSAYGTKPLRIDAPFAELPTGAALSKFRAYDLPLAMRLTRAVRYLTPETDAALAACAAFIRSSQGDDGGFGDYDTALATLARRGHTGVKSSIRCAVTLDALWTMAELVSPDCRVVRSLFGDGGLVRAAKHAGATIC